MRRMVLILRHVAHEPAGTLEAALADAGLGFHYVDLYEETPARLPFEKVSGLVVLGGPMNADESSQYPFLASDVRWIRQAIGMEIPLLGICLGSQLLAKALGTRVYPNNVKEIGWYPVELTAAATDDSLFAGSGTWTVFQWHGDTFDLPSGACRLARSPLCENQAFRYAHNTWGLQFHIEMTAELIENWLNQPGNCRELAELDYVDPQKIRDQVPQELPRLQRLAAVVLGRFSRMCRAVTPR